MASTAARGRGSRMSELVSQLRVSRYAGDTTSIFDDDHSCGRQPLLTAGITAPGLDCEFTNKQHKEMTTTAFARSARFVDLGSGSESRSGLGLM